MPKKKQDVLTGEALLEKFKALGALSEKEKAKACGYVGLTRRGSERVNLMQFRNALIDAVGLDLDSKGKQGARRRGGRSATYRVKVQSNGNLLIGAAYTRQMNLQPGDEFQIIMGRHHIRLSQLEDGDVSGVGDMDVAD